jgi:hypothetical protein
MIHDTIANAKTRYQDVRRTWPMVGVRTQTEIISIGGMCVKRPVVIAMVKDLTIQILQEAVM